VEEVDGVPDDVDVVAGLEVVVAGVADTDNEAVELFADGKLEVGDSILLGGGVDASSISMSSSLV
jgi:hypothetical protein